MTIVNCREFSRTGGTLELTKPFEISKLWVLDAYHRVKANKGAAGIDGQTLEDFEKDLKNNLYRIWNRLSSGSYFPPAVKAVPIPKKTGGERLLGVPTVSDRVAQMVVKMQLEPQMERIFDDNSFGYRPKKSAHDAIAVTRRRCWQNDWIVEFDIKGLFDNIDHHLLMKAVRHHCKIKWILLLIERWLKAPILHSDGRLETRTMGTPQGGVISPLLANLFLHYTFDAWVRRNLPEIPFCRYADDGLLHCKSHRQAKYVLKRIETRFKECGLTIHPEKSGIIYCKDRNRKDNYARISFDFLGYTFRPRRCVDKQGRLHPNFLPAISQVSQKAIRQKIRSWHIQLKNEKSISDLARMFNAKLCGWFQYYGRFYPSEMSSIWRHLDWYLIQWIRRKHKRFAYHKRRARNFLNCLKIGSPALFFHWRLEVTSK